MTDDPGLAVRSRRVLHAALRPLQLARRNTRGAHEHVDAKIESGVRLRVVHAKVRPMHPGPRVIFGYLIILSILVGRTEREARS